MLVFHGIDVVQTWNTIEINSNVSHQILREQTKNMFFISDVENIFWH